MKIDEHSDFDCDPGTLLALFTTRAYFVRKYENLGAKEIDVLECGDDGDHFAITTHQYEPQNKPLPAFLRKVVGQRIGMTRSDAWERSTRRGRMVVELDSAPVTIGVDMALEGLEPGVRLHLHFDIQAGVPVVAGQIEKFLAEDIVGRIKNDLDESRRLLPEYVS